MRHRVKGRKLSRNTAHRKAMLKNLANSLLKHEGIRTTSPRAKELRMFIEPIITKAGNDSVANRRRAFSQLRDKEMVAKLYSDIGPHFKERPGGYLRIIKCGFRPGDQAEMSFIQLVDRQPAEAEEA